MVRLDLNTILHALNLLYYHIATVEVCKVLLFALNLAITTF